MKRRIAWSTFQAATSRAREEDVQPTSEPRFPPPVRLLLVLLSILAVVLTAIFSYASTLLDPDVGDLAPRTLPLLAAGDLPHRHLEAAPPVQAPAHGLSGGPLGQARGEGTAPLSPTPPGVSQLLAEVEGLLAPAERLEAPPDPAGSLAGALAALRAAYGGDVVRRTRGFAARSQAAEEVQRAVGSARPATYGEVLPETVAAMLHRLGARAGQRYYDLGSGTGKTAALAWLLGLDATGVELVSARWRSFARPAGSPSSAPPTAQLG